MKTWDLGFEIPLADRQSWNKGLWHLQRAVKTHLFPPPEWTSQMLYSEIFSVILLLLSSHTTVGVMNRRHIWRTQTNHIKNWGFGFSERRTVSFKMQPCHGPGMNFVSLLFQLILGVGWLAHSHQGLCSLCICRAQVTSVSSFYPREI